MFHSSFLYLLEAICLFVLLQVSSFFLSYFLPLSSFLHPSLLYTRTDWYISLAPTTYELLNSVTELKSVLNIPVIYMLCLYYNPNVMAHHL